MILVPTIPSPPDVVPNFVKPYSLQRYDVLCQSVCFTTATLLVCLRIYTKTRVLRQAGWDDLTSVLAWLGLMAYMIVTLEEDRFGNGRHLWNVTPENLTKFAKVKLANISQIIYSPIICMTKVSILLLYLRVFGPKRRMYMAINILIWANVLFYTAGLFVEIFQCNPRDKAWDSHIPGKCIDERAAQLASAAVNTFSDFAILILPIRIIWGLNLPRNQKLGALAVFGTGFLGCIASIIRMIIIIRDKNVLDVTWDWYSLDLLTTAEITCGIICGCLPALPAFINHLRGKPAPNAPAVSRRYEQQAGYVAPRPEIVDRYASMQELKDMQDEDYDEEPASGLSRTTESEADPAVSNPGVSDKETNEFC